MEWRGRTLRVGRRKYVFEDKVKNCGKVGKSLAVVFKKAVLFVGKEGAFVKHPTKPIKTSCFFGKGVLFSEEHTRTVQHMAHPYEAIEKKTLKHEFEHLAGDRKQFALVAKAEGRRYIEIYRGDRGRLLCAELVFRKEVPKDTVKIILKSNRYALVYAAGVEIVTLGKSRDGNSLVIEGEFTYSAQDRIESVVQVSSNQSLAVLVNGRVLFDQSGYLMAVSLPDPENNRKIFSGLSGCGSKDAEKNQHITKKAARAISRIKRGYAARELENIFDFETEAHRIFFAALPGRLQRKITKERAVQDPGRTDKLFTQAIAELTREEADRVSRAIERHIHISKSVSNIASPLFIALAEKVSETNKRLSYLFHLLSPSRKVHDLLTYELLPYRSKMIRKSKNIGYKIIRKDLRETHSERERNSQIETKHTLEDPEHIREIPKRMKNTNIIEECKELFTGQAVGEFLFDEYDTENRRRKAFVFSILSSVGRGVFLFNRNYQTNLFQVPSLKVFIRKNNSVVSLSSLSEWDKFWPSFHNSVACALSVPNRPFISTLHMDVVTPKSIMCIAGAVFGFGLKESVDVGRLSLSERLALTKSLLLSLSKTCHSLIISATVLGNSFVLRGTCNQKLSSILWYNIKTRESDHVLLMWSVLSLGVLYAGSNDLFAKQAVISYISRKGAIPGGGSGTHAHYYDRLHRVAGAFSLAYIGAGCETKEYTRLENRTCELIVNGLVYFNTRMEKIGRLLEERSPKCTPVNRFYSSLMRSLVMGESGHEEAFRDALCAATEERAYEIAGRIFACGIQNIPKREKPNEKFAADVIGLLYALERRKSAHTVVLDYTLLAACLVLNSTEDLRVLGTCKRLLHLSLRNINALEKIVDYSPCAGEYREQYGTRYGRIQHIKMCLSLLVPGCGAMKIDPTPLGVAFLVTSFYVEFPIAPEDQDAFQVVRHFYLLSLSAASEQAKTTKDAEITDRFYQRLSKMPTEDIKTALDILSTYFEKNPSKTLSRTTLEHLIESGYEEIENRATPEESA